MPRISFAWEDILISHNMNVYRVFLESLDPYIEQSLHDWNLLIQQEGEKIADPNAQDDFYQFHADEYEHRLQVRPLLMNACFTAIFALFEEQLLRICAMAKEHSRSPFSVGHLRGGSPTDLAKMYLQILEVDFPSGGDDWTRITWLREIRNKIIHNGGILLDHKNKYKTVKYAVDSGIVVDRLIRNEGEHIPSSEESGAASEMKPEPLRLELTRGFCEAELNHLEEFLHQVYSAYIKWSAKPKPR